MFSNLVFAALFFAGAFSSRLLLPCRCSGERLLRPPRELLLPTCSSSAPTFRVIQALLGHHSIRTTVR
ncbi:hypothetical protein WME91_07320 [Sorangium sp. So ce269]